MLDVVGIGNDGLHIVDMFPVSWIEGECGPWNVFDGISRMPD